MERKVGEIFEYNGEWYQCVEGTGCYKCAFYDKNICIANNPHCTCRSDGRKARIICFDRNWEYPIVALIECENGEEMISACDKDGKARIYETQGTDLMMLPQKKEGWIIIHKEAIYDKETAEKIARETTANVIRIQKIEWEE